MDLQTVIVWIIGIIVAGIFVRWLFRTLTGRNRTGCATCNDTECPLRKSPAKRPQYPAPAKRNAPKTSSCKRIRKNGGKIA